MENPRHAFGLELDVIFGVDISQWQGLPNLPALQAFLATDQLQFVMLRTEDGAHVDGKFDAYCTAFNNIGLYELGTYMFFRAHLPVQAQCERAAMMHGDLPGPLAVDMETLDEVAPELAASATLEALERMTALMGRKPLLYSDFGDWSKLGAHGKGPAFADYPLWLAAVTEDPKKITAVPAPWTSAIMRQYTWQRRIPGFSGNVDGDAFYGSIEDWRNIGRSAATPST